MGQITSSGLASGLDVNAIIKAITDAERAPATLRLNRLEAKTSARLAAYSAIIAPLNELKSAVDKLDSASDFNQRTTTLSSADYIKVTTTSDISPGSFAVEVEQLAAGSSAQSAVFATGSSSTVGSGTLTFTAGSKTFNVSILGTDTLLQIRDKINAGSGNFGVSANIINADGGAYLTLSSSETGAANTLAVTNDNASLDSISTALTVTAAKSARIKIDGQTVTSTTNTFTNAIQNTTITVVKQNTATETTKVTVAKNKDSVKSAVQSLVKAFNSVIDAVNKQTRADKNPQARGALVGDSSISGIVTSVRRYLGTVVDSESAYPNLTSLGITTTRTGTIELNSSTLDKALDSSYEKVIDLFSNSTSGIAKQIGSYVDSLASTTGSLKSAQTSMQGTLEKITDEREMLDLRINKIKTRLQQQYGALDSLVSKLNGTASFLSKNLAKSSS